MGCCAIGRLADEEIGLFSGDFCGDQVSVVLARVITREHDFETSDFDEEHGATEDMASVVGGYGDTRMGECCVVIDGFDAGVGRKMVGFGVESFRSVVDVAEMEVSRRTGYL